MPFYDEISTYDPQRLEDEILAKTSSEVERALATPHLRLEEFKALLSPAAANYLEPMAQRAHRLTVQRFGKTILMYAPLYLSNECSNGCRYCGFNAGNKMARRTLTLDEIATEARVLHERGFRHLLLVTGEAPKLADNKYLCAAVERLRPLFSSMSIEVYPMDRTGYAQVVTSGVDGLTLYQETYDPALYAEMHPFGKKRDYNFRLAAPEAAAAAGIRRIGIGALLGLGKFRNEGFFTGLHALYLARHYWRTHLAVSFPRMRPADGGFQPLHPVPDRDFVQLICALRLLLPDVGLVMSTRESATLRDHLLPLGITQMSAGSCTSPGGYAEHDDSGQQFVIDDDRNHREVAAMIARQGYEPVWKDWDPAFHLSD
ncbi:MAG: thiamine biosynthesis protein ThiH [Desulfuromonadales bacterium GWD2_61_12]|nr:MAG: thiamine biosynthesis protein ThiH [Desulfuromonadales bacterium GWC2_61_20]OGR36556.1 MAG: thiamine biosynthesis protein ThiH [Desulfuromonadales bacterium GWD2_61_12]HAD05035.1 2-iminoacetate synthase ThiH [Desulfuromonas sp.]HBT83314.1 2-iminoacetate synthase ThiH [Desulfuromonas sp.]